MDATDIEQLDEFRVNLESFRQEGLTAKNKALIRQVLNQDVWRSILRLPARLMEEARRTEEHAPVKAALIAQRAIAIEILTIAPIRLGNLGRIRLGENLIKPGGSMDAIGCSSPIMTSKTASRSNTNSISGSQT